jgi:glycerol-3-phosphate acyltransferase PlsY
MTVAQIWPESGGLSNYRRLLGNLSSWWHRFNGSNALAGSVGMTVAQSWPGSGGLPNHFRLLGNLSSWWHRFNGSNALAGSVGRGKSLRVIRWLLSSACPAIKQ